MYSQLFNYKIDIGEQSASAAQHAFEELAGSADSFDFLMFQRARENNPHLLEWMDEPQLYIQSKTAAANISQKAFREYHTEVMLQIDTLEDQLAKALGIESQEAQ